MLLLIVSYSFSQTDNNFREQETSETSLPWEKYCFATKQSQQAGVAG